MYSSTKHSHYQGLHPARGAHHPMMCTVSLRRNSHNHTNTRVMPESFPVPTHKGQRMSFTNSPAMPLAGARGYSNYSLLPTRASTTAPPGNSLIVTTHTEIRMKQCFYKVKLRMKLPSEWLYLNPVLNSFYACIYVSYV